MFELLKKIKGGDAWIELYNLSKLRKKQMKQNLGEDFEITEEDSMDYEI
jgi:hypothetical protein